VRTPGNEPKTFCTRETSARAATVPPFITAGVIVTEFDVLAPEACPHEDTYVPDVVTVLPVVLNDTTGNCCAADALTTRPVASAIATVVPSGASTNTTRILSLPNVCGAAVNVTTPDIYDLTIQFIIWGFVVPAAVASAAESNKCTLTFQRVILLATKLVPPNVTVHPTSGSFAWSVPENVRLLSELGATYSYRVPVYPTISTNEPSPPDAIEHPTK
jgi:hypothetical protein